MPVNLSKDQKIIFESVRNTLTEVLVSASRSNLPRENTETLRDTLKSLEDHFLIVVVGEFNSGKSSFINALLNTEILETGVTPTTALIHLLRHGAETTSTPIEDWGLLITLPSPLLESISLVDTPGTNSVFADHAVLTNWFFPRADLVVFITSADRPYSESESQFLKAVREWGKKTIIILNKSDLIETDEQRASILNFVRDNAEKEFKSDIPVFSVSARQALNARHQQSRELWAQSGFDQIESFIQDKLNEKSRFNVKMAAALSIGSRLAQQTLELQQEEIQFYQEDLILADDISEQFQHYKTEIDREIQRSLTEIRAIFTEIKQSGAQYFESLFKIKNIPNLVRKDKNRLEFQDQVLKSLPTDVERKTTELVETIYSQEQRVTQAAMLQIEQRKTRFPGSGLDTPDRMERAALLQKMQSSIDEMLTKMQTDIAADIAVRHVQTAMTTALAIEVSAIGLGAALTIAATTVATDILGIVAAFWVGIAGFLVLPYYRKKSQQEFNEQITEIENKLINSLEKELNHEVQAQFKQMDQAISPFRSFVQNALDRILKQNEDMETLLSRMQELRSKLS